MLPDGVSHVGFTDRHFALCRMCSIEQGCDLSATCIRKKRFEFEHFMLDPGWLGLDSVVARGGDMDAGTFAYIRNPAEKRAQFI